jgi:hypothetical protein
VLLRRRWCRQSTFTSYEPCRLNLVCGVYLLLAGGRGLFSSYGGTERPVPWHPKNFPVVSWSLWRALCCAPQRPSSSSSAVCYGVGWSLRPMLRSHCFHPVPQPIFSDSIIHSMQSRSSLAFKINAGKASVLRFPLNLYPKPVRCI